MVTQSAMGVPSFARGLRTSAGIVRRWKVGIAALTVLNTINALVQLATEPAMRGSVMALRLTVTLGGAPVGAPVMGWGADRFGPRLAPGVRRPRRWLRP